MRISKPIKILLGLLTAWVALLPLIFIAVWFSTMFLIIGSVEYLTAPENIVVPVIFFPTFILIMCSSFLQLGLTAFYLAHVILNKTGNDILRVVLGIFVFIFPYIAMPVYYFIYILPKYPPSWALAVSPGQMVSVDPS
jgi:hypothetical protein